MICPGNQLKVLCDAVNKASTLILLNESDATQSEPCLSTKRVSARLNWRTEGEHWTTQQWDAIAFSDESLFTLRSVKNYSRVWRKVGTRYETDNIVPTFKFGNSLLCIWGMFSSHGHSTLIHISGTLNQSKYIEILKQHVLPLKNTHHAADFVE